jgi:uncharacterized protein YdhG (YjbR/CyaY superfamily)
MTSREIDDYLATLDEPKRSTLEQVRRTILDLLPDAEECISYQLPAYRVGGKVIAGFGAFKNHLTYVPHSGSVLDKIPEAAAYGGTKSALHFPIDEPLPRDLIRKLVEVRLSQTR